MPSLDAIEGVLLGTAIGDALGLPHEGLGPARIERRLRRGGLRHSMVLGRGLLSDDTEHTTMVARALCHSRGEVHPFRQALARQLRRWVLALPPGVGLATLRGALRLCFGVPAHRSGVRSAGNGPAMRAALLGLCARDDANLVALVRASTRVTHTDPRAEDGALWVARMARCGALGMDTSGVEASLRDEDFRRQVFDASVFEGDLAAFRTHAGFERGVSGFIVHTLVAVAYCVQPRFSPSQAIESAVRLGGDTDTVAAIVGALVGARAGASGLPAPWVEGITDWPISVQSLRALARALVRREPPPSQRWLVALPRNLAVVALIVGHLGLRALGR